MSSSPGTEKLETGQTTPFDNDANELKAIGYTPVFKRTFGIVESFASSYCAMNSIGVTRTLLFIGLACGGPSALFTSSIIHVFGAGITSLVLAEICSALPLSGSIYVWSAEAVGPKYGRLAGFVVGFWASVAWVSFVASNSQAPAQYLISLSTLFDDYFPGGLTTTNVKYRALLWGVSMGCMWIALALSYFPPKFQKLVFRINIGVLVLDLLLNIIWLPIGVSRTYGFRSAKEVFTATSNSTGFPNGWAWCLAFYYAGYTACGYDAAGHVAEETKNASNTSAKGIVFSAYAASLTAFFVTILWLFTIPPAEILATYTAPQPFVQLYGDALGRGGAVFMSVVSVLGLIGSSYCAVVASSRLIFAIARDGILPGSKWISTPSPSGVPRNAITFIGIVATVLLVISLPSQVAFTSLMSAAAVTSLSAYALIALGRLLLTRGDFKHSKWSLGKFGVPCYIIAAGYNLFLLTIMYSPLGYPFTAETFNFAIVIMVAITIFGFISWWFVPASAWLRPELVKAMRAHADAEAEQRYKEKA